MCRVSAPTHRSPSILLHGRCHVRDLSVGSTRVLCLGSHVVVLVPPRAQVRHEDIVFAARIAAAHSKAKKDTYVDVSYTERKHLRQPPQRVRKPGSVMMMKEQVRGVLFLSRTVLFSVSLRRARLEARRKRKTGKSIDLSRACR